MYRTRTYSYSIIFFFNYTATAEIYTLSLHDALPIFHHPGHRELRSGPDGDEERVLGIAEALVHRLLEPREMLTGLLQHLGRWATVAEEPQAGLGGDREPGRDREPHVRHLGEVGSLAAQEILHVLVAFGEVVDVLGHSRCPHALERSRSGQCTAVPARGLPRMTSAG